MPLIATGRIALRPGQAVGELRAPRLPLRLCARPSRRVLLLPSLGVFLDGGGENAPYPTGYPSGDPSADACSYACEASPAAFVQRARRPNARLELWPNLHAHRSGVHEVLWLLIASDCFRLLPSASDCS